MKVTDSKNAIYRLAMSVNGKSNFFNLSLLLQATIPSLMEH